ncbi:hypothetical protein Bca101_017322 [Brassica carinata]
MSRRKGGVRCSMESKQVNVSAVGAGVSAAALTAVMSDPAMALVDDRMSTEGTGLPFVLSNNLLGWILLGVFGLIWTFYFVYTSSLEEDEESANRTKHDKSSYEVDSEFKVKLECVDKAFTTKSDS